MRIVLAVRRARPAAEIVPKDLLLRARTALKLVGFGLLTLYSSLLAASTQCRLVVAIVVGVMAWRLAAPSESFNEK